jgi:hypothetical protein
MYDSSRCVALEGRQKSRNTVVLLVLSCLRSSALTSQIANTRAACDSQPCLSLFASRSPELPSSPSASFEKPCLCNPYRATHANASCCHARHTLTTLRKVDRIFDIFLCTYPGAQEATYRRQGCSSSRFRLHVCTSPPRIDVVRKAAGQARELASAETLAPARPISSQTSVVHLTTIRNTSAGPVTTIHACWPGRSSPPGCFHSCSLSLLAFAVMLRRSVTSPLKPSLSVL